VPGETAGIWRYKFWKLIVEIPTTPWKFKIDPETKPSQKERIIFQAPFFLLGLKTHKLQLRVCISKVLLFIPGFGIFGHGFWDHFGSSPRHLSMENNQLTALPNDLGQLDVLGPLGTSMESKASEFV